MYSETYSTASTNYLFAPEQTFLETRQAKFRPSLNVSQDKLPALTAAVHPLIDVGRRRTRPASRRAKDQRMMGCIIANAATADRVGTTCFYSRDKDRYTSGSPYGSDWLTSTSLCDTTKLMGQHRLLDHVIAERGINVEHQSTFAPTDDLRRILSDQGIGPEHIFSDPDDHDPIILKWATGRLARFDVDDSEVRRKAILVNTYNDFQSDFKCSYIPKTDWKVSPTGRLVYRVFNNGSFEQGGRFYGSWWLLLYKDERESILINEESTVEIDYSSMFPRMLYSFQGIDYREQAYNVPVVMQMAQDQGINFAEAVKPSLKIMLNMAINASEQLYFGDARFCGIQGLSCAEANRLLWEMHPAIQRYQYSGAGIYLMYTESLIAEHVIANALNASIPILVIHDAFRVQSKNREWLFHQMIESYRYYRNHDPVI